MIRQQRSRLDPILTIFHIRTISARPWAISVYRDCLADSTNVIRIDPENADGYAERALAYGAMKKYEEALQDCTEALRLDPRFAYSHTIRGWVYKCSKKNDAAIAAYSEAIRLSPVDPDLYIRRADVRLRVWDCAGAIADYKQAVELAPEDAKAKTQLAGFLSSFPDAHLRDGKEARELATEACEATSWRDWASLDSLAAACAECDDFDDAVKWETKAVERAPDSEKRHTQKRLELYRAHKPYRVKPPKGASASPSTK